MSDKTTTLEINADGVAVITLNRPQVHNSFNTQMADELIAHAAVLRGREDVGAVVVVGAGEKAFCAGADIAEFGALSTGDHFHTFISKLSAAVEAISSLPQPVIAAVEGIAFGGGCELALACDFRTAAERTKFGLPEVKLGLLPGLGGTQRAIRLLPRSVALKLLVTGDPLDAESAFNHGLCERPVAAGGALADAMKFATALCAGPREAIVAAKQIIDDGLALDLPAAIAMEQEVGRRLFNTPDAREGVSAFLEKRPATFKKP